MAVPEEGFKLNLGGHLLEDSGSGITKVFEHVGKTLGHGAVSSDMPVWDHARNVWGSIRDRYSGDKCELKKVITALMETPYEALDAWDDRPLRQWMLQHTSDQGVIDLWEFLWVLECMTDNGYDHSASDNLSVRKMQDSEARRAGYSFWPRRAGTASSGISRCGARARRPGHAGHAGRVGGDRGLGGQGRDARAPQGDAQRVPRGRGARGGLRDLDAAGVERAASCPRARCPSATSRRSATSPRTICGSPGSGCTWPRARRPFA